MDPFNFPPVAAVFDAVYGGVLWASTWAGAPLAIVLLTVVVRAALIPVGISQVKAEWTRRRLAPALAALQQKYTTNPQKLQEKTLALYRAENASPFAGMLPALAQAPVLSIVYALFIRASIDGHANALLAALLLNVPLGATLVSGAGLPIFAVLLLVIAASAFLTRRTTLRLNPQTPRWLSWLPFIAVPFAAFVPLAATLYLAVSTLWTLGERAVLRRIYWKPVTA